MSADKMKQKHTVRVQEVTNKSSNVSAAQAKVGQSTEVDVGTNKSNTPTVNGHRNGRVNEVDQSDGSNKEKPPVEEEVELLVYHVHHDNTLDSVTLGVGQTTNLK